MKNKAFWRAMDCLSHPLSMGAILLLLLNDHLLRQTRPSWWTGKIGDFAWLLFAPFVLAALLAWLIPPLLANQEKAVGWLAFSLTGLEFALVNLFSPFHALTVRGLEALLGWEVKLWRDPTDLLALPMLLIGCFLWKRKRVLLPSRRGWVAISLAVLATVANTPAPPDYGITCLAKRNSTIIALQTSWDPAFASEDGGLTWRRVTPSEISSLTKVKCEWFTESWQISNPRDEQIVYRFLPAEGIERSEDGGQSWHREVNLSWGKTREFYYKRFRDSEWGRTEMDPGPLDAVIHPSTRNVVVAMGHEGVLVRTPNGEWHWVAVGPYERVDLKSAGTIRSLISGELWLALVLFFMALGTLACHGGQNRLIEYLVVAGWCLWGFIVIAGPAAHYATAGHMVNFSGMITPLILVSGLLAAPLGLRVLELYHLSPLALMVAVVTAASGGVLFALPYVLWSQGGISRYSTATLFALLLAAATVSAGAWYLQRLLGAISPAVEAEEEERPEALRAPVKWTFGLQWMLATPVGYVVGVLLGGRISAGVSIIPYHMLRWVGSEVVKGAVIGASIGLMQWVVLRRRGRWGRWALASTLGMAVAWALAGNVRLLLSSTFGIKEYGISYAISKAVVGTLLGCAQWLVLRHQARRAGWWILASAVGWSLGLAIELLLARTIIGNVLMGAWIVVGALLGMDGAQTNVAAIAVIAGAVVGAVTGSVLVWLLQRSG